MSAATDIRAHIDAALVSHDRTAAVRAALTAVRNGGIGIDELYSDVLTPLLVDTGSAWQRGDARVWEEHLATSIVRTVVEALCLDAAEAASAVAPLNRTVLLACPPGEQHDLGLRMLADRLLLRGWKVHFLGADTPVDDIAAAAVALDADLVALSAATHYNRVLLRSVLDDLRVKLPHVKVGVGGPAFALHHPWPREDVLLESDLLQDASEPTQDR